MDARDVKRILRKYMYEDQCCQGGFFETNKLPYHIRQYKTHICPFFMIALFVRRM